MRALRATASRAPTAKTLRRWSWNLLGKPWLLPPLLVLGVLGLLTADVTVSPVQVFHERGARDLLANIWQVEAAAVALVLAGALFAFESLTRQRPELSLTEYANRSGLSQFFMLAASGLLVIPMVLASTPKTPDPSASLVAFVIALAGLATLPFFFYQAMKVVHPGWLQDERVDHLRIQMREAVEADVVSRLSSGILAEWARQHGIELGHRYGLSDDRITETASDSSTVLDIDLKAAGSLAEGRPGTVILLTHLGETLWGGAPLVALSDGTGRRHTRPLVTTSKRALEDPLPPLLQELHGEANDAIQRGSARTAEAVAELYTELWLAWLREWERYGQKLQGGLLQGTEPFRLGPTSELRRNLRIQMERSVDQGLRDHADATGGILWSVGLESLRHGAADLVGEMHLMARSYLTISSQRYPDLANQVRDNAWRYQIRILEYAAHDLDDISLADDEDRRKSSVGMVDLTIRAVTESLKALLDNGYLNDFRKLDNRFREVRLPTRFEDDRFFEERMAEDPTATEQEIARARRKLETADSISDLEALRGAGRLSVLGWAVRGDDLLADENLMDQVRSMAQSFGSTDDLMSAAEVALDYGRTFTSDWVMFDLPEGQAHFIDADGPVLTALIVSLLAKTTIGDIPGSPWMTQNRMERLNSIVEQVASWEPLWRRVGESDENVAERAEDLKNALADAEGQQRSREKFDLIDSPLDPSKVQVFHDNVYEGWSENRIVREFAQLGGISISEIPESEWGDIRFRLDGLDPKGLFITPSNWVGLDHNAKELGRTLARNEVGAIVRLAVAQETEVPSHGDALERVETLLDQARSDGLEPSLILIPIHWRLLEALGLRVDPPRRNPGSLGWHMKGRINGIPVVDWRDVPDDRIYVIDGHLFCEVVEGVRADGEPAPPEVAILSIDEERAREITAKWQPLGSTDEERERLLDVQSRAERHISRPYRVDKRETDGVRYTIFDQPRKNPERNSDDGD